MTTVRPICFNGKFYAGGMNGVHRVSDRLIRECDKLLAAMPVAERPKVRLLLPTADQRKWQPELVAIDTVECPGANSQKWEQLTLPRLAANDVLVNLANLAPLRHRRKVLLLHDAQFLFPDSSYPWKQRIGYRLLTPHMARSSERVLTVSDYSRQMLDLLGVCDRQRSAVLYNGADHILDTEKDPQALDRLGLIPGGYALMFGSAKAYKNNRVVLEAFADGSLAPLRLVIVGADRDALNSSGLDVPKETIFAGRCDDAILRSLYEGAQCFLFPSRTEGFGLPPLEAMLCNCPAIVAPAGAIPEICRDAALYADVDCPESWREAIRSLSLPELRASKTAEGRKRAEEFTWQAAGRRLWSELLTLANY